MQEVSYVMSELMRFVKLLCSCRTPYILQHCMLLIAIPPLYSQFQIGCQNIYKSCISAYAYMMKNGCQWKQVKCHHQPTGMGRVVITPLTSMAGFQAANPRVSQSIHVSQPASCINCILLKAVQKNGGKSKMFTIVMWTLM